MPFWSAILLPKWGSEVSQNSKRVSMKAWTEKGLQIGQKSNWPEPEYCGYPSETRLPIWALGDRLCSTQGLWGSQTGRFRGSRVATEFALLGPCEARHGATL